MKTLERSLILFIVTALYCCSKKSDMGNNLNNGGGNNTNTTPYDSAYNPVDPAVTTTQGFFLDDWAAKSFTVPSFTPAPPVLTPATDTIKIDADIVLTKVSKYLFGANSNLWMGQVVTVPNLMQYITDLSPNVIRGPAGSVSDVYFWNATTTPADVPASLLDANGAATSTTYWYGQNTQSWTLALDNYYALLQQTKSVGLQTVNFGYSRYGTSANPVAAAAHLAADWVRYDNGRTKFWEIGNENYGNWESGYLIDTTLSTYKQPRIITGTDYGQNFLVYADSMRNAAQSIGVDIKIGALLLGGPVNGSNQVGNWNSTALTAIGNNADFFIIHDYYPDESYATNAPGSQILSDAISVPATDMNYLNSNIPGSGVSLKPVAMTEFNISSQGSQQQISFVNAMAGVLTDGELMKNHFGQGSRWDLANGWSNGNDQGMLYNSANTGDPNPSETNWNPRASFYTLYYFQRFMGDRLVNSTSTNTSLSVYSSTFAASNNIASVIVNTGTVDKVVDVNINHFPMGTNVYFYTLKGGTDNGEFSAKVSVNGVAASQAIGGPLNYASIPASSTTRNGNNIALYCPARSIVYMVVDKK
ncbi:MAG TPA: hypothetical protein VK711_11935 [Puia sp.]|nr:hypothetical protein [Puia sp.]